MMQIPHTSENIFLLIPPCAKSIVSLQWCTRIEPLESRETQFYQFVCEVLWIRVYVLFSITFRILNLNLHVSSLFYLILPPAGLI